MKWLLSLSLLLLFAAPAAAQQVRLTEDVRGVQIQGVMRLGTEHTTAVQPTSTMISALGINTNVVMLICSVACHIAQTATPATATVSSMLFPANERVYLRVNGQFDSIAVIADSTAGTLYVVEMK